MEHTAGIGFIPGLTQDFVSQHHDGVCGDDHIVSPAADSLRFPAADLGHGVRRGEGGVHGLVSVRYPDNKGNMEQSHQLFAAGGLGCQNDFHAKIPS